MTTSGEKPEVCQSLSEPATLLTGAASRRTPKRERHAKEAIDGDGLEAGCQDHVVRVCFCMLFLLRNSATGGRGERGHLNTLHHV